jgi:DNA-binding MarR family transcriptional regulator
MKMAEFDRTLKPPQKRVLKHLALEGEDYLNKIAPKIGFTLTRAKNSLKRLSQYRLIWQSKGSRDSKSREAKFYSLTHYGVVEAFISLLNYEETSQMIENWKLYAPQYVINFKKFKEKGILEDLKILLLNFYPSIVRPWREAEHRINGINMVAPRVQAHVLDTTLFYEIFQWNRLNIDGEFQYKFLEIVVQDPVYKEGWERWFYITKSSIETLESTYDRIKKA